MQHADCQHEFRFAHGYLRMIGGSMMRISTIKVIAAWLILSLCGAMAHAGTVTYVYTDAQGTPLAEADASGTITAVFDYAPYGAQALGAPPSGPGYTGHVNDAESGFVYMQQRYYDPSVGRMLSRDSVTVYGTSDTRYFNAYAYAFNNPYRFSDPDGRCPTCDRFSDNYAQAAREGRTGEFAVLEKPAIAVATAALPLGAAGRAVVGLARAVGSLISRREATTQNSQSRGELHAPGDVPDANVVVRGGTGEMPAPGTSFSGSQGRTVEDAGVGVPHGTIRTSTAGEIRSSGGRVDVAPEPTRSGQMNGQHVNVTEGGTNSTFGQPQPNPVPKPERIK